MDEITQRIFEITNFYASEILDEKNETLARACFRTWGNLQKVIDLLGLRDDYVIWKRNQK